ERIAQDGPEASRAAVRRQAMGVNLLENVLLAIPVVEKAGDGIDAFMGHAQGLADLAHDAAVAVADGHGRHGGADPAIAFINVLDDFFTAFVLEIHVYIRRLVAGPADETGEQAVATSGVDFGDAQAIADGGIGCRAPPLAENAAAACEFHDVVDGEEVGFV